MLSSTDLHRDTRVQLRGQKSVGWAAPLPEKMHTGLWKKMQREDLGSWVPCVKSLLHPVVALPAEIPVLL